MVLKLLCLALSDVFYVPVQMTRATQSRSLFCTWCLSQLTGEKNKNVGGVEIRQGRVTLTGLQRFKAGR